MKKFFLLVLLAPLLTLAQSTTKPAGGFIIHGTSKGYQDSTPVALLNGMTGVPIAETIVLKNKFEFAGKMAVPEICIILFERQQPFVSVFLDNSDITVQAVRDSLATAVVKGSPAHDAFEVFNRSMLPYQAAFTEAGSGDTVLVAKARETAAKFARENPTSYVAPLAVVHYLQLSEDPALVEQLFSGLDTSVKNTSMGAYLAQQIQDARKNAIGTVLADFTQADTTGKPVTLASYRGKYVLIDFWASWCRPCREENPNVVANYNRFKGKNFTVLGVSLDKTRPAWVNAINADGLAWGHVSDLQGWTSAVARQLGITSIPQNFLIDPNGKIIAKNLRGPALERKLESLLH